MPLRLLLLEDNPDDAHLLRSSLAARAPGEFAITAVGRLADALTQLKSASFDVVLSDLGLPDSLGLSAVDAIARCAPELPLVVLTGEPNQALGPEALRHGAQDYLVKGDSSGALIARTLRYALERKRLELDLREANRTLEVRVAERTAELETAIDSLRESEARYRGLVEQAIAGIFILQEGKLAYVNPRFAQIYGYDSAAELIGRDTLSNVTAQDRALVTESRRLLLEGAVASSDYRFTAVRRDGTTIEVGAHGARASYQGRPAIIGLIQDISEKARAEERIQRYTEQLKTAFMSTVEVATTLSEMRDPYTAGHERRVAEIAAAIGAEIGLDAQRIQGLRVAGFLHDIGKITIPSEILSKPGKLSSIELKLIQGHSQASHDVLKDVDFPWPVALMALQHHERIDGSGYPQGLKGEAILLEARILAVADVVEAMSSHRPYRPGLGIERALAEIERGRGAIYDAVVADACLKLFREKGYAIP